MTLCELYERLGPAARLDAERAERIVSEALPHAVAALGDGVDLHVRVQRVDPGAARGGSLIPAWPLKNEDGRVTIEYVNDWGALLAAWLSQVEPDRQALALDLLNAGQRTWIGIANDVLQLFVTDPPAGSYSMVRHHALMLAAATVWLGPRAIRDWCTVHASAAHAFLRVDGRVRPPGAAALWAAVKTAEGGLDRLLLDPRCRQPAPHALAWLDSDSDARAAYTDFLGAASFGVAAVLSTLSQSEMPPERWLRHAVADRHPDPDFNKNWMEVFLKLKLKEMESRA